MVELALADGGNRQDAIQRRGVVAFVVKLVE
jgi:hypothetical protein